MTTGISKCLMETALFLSFTVTTYRSHCYPHDLGLSSALFCLGSPRSNTWDKTQVVYLRDEPRRLKGEGGSRQRRQRAIGYVIKSETTMGSECLVPGGTLGISMLTLLVWQPTWPLDQYVTERNKLSFVSFVIMLLMKFLWKESTDKV